MRGLLVLGALLLSSLSNIAHADNSLADDVIGNLYGMKSIYRAQYAPAEWKKKFAGYDLDQQFAKSVAAVQNNPNFGFSDVRPVLLDFINSMRDYHTSIQFVSTETASLPFMVHGTDSQQFIVYIDRNKLSEAAFPFQVGDELVSFGGMKASAAVKAVQDETIENTPATDKGMAEMSLTNRRAARGLKVPKGPIVVEIKRKGQAKAVRHEMIWDYTPEQIAPRSPSLAFAQAETDGPKPSSVFHPIMSVMVDKAENRFGLGARQTFTPDLGQKVWESLADDSFYAYIFKTADRKLIGYVRIAGYIMPDYNKAVADFAKIIQRFELTTDSMVIDQPNNPGGSVFYLYALASMLTDQPLRTPLHHMSITQADVMSAIESKARYINVKNDEDAKKAATAEDGADGYPVTYEFARFTLSFCDFIIDQWTQGHRLTAPYWIGGVNQINPAAVHYTKPILLVTNHLDFSGGDFFPAIMQDNKRVRIFGTRTAGAGGYVLEQKVTNNIGISVFRVTGSIAARTDGNPIENLGVTPDDGFEYELTAEDYQNNYAPYVKAMLAAINSL